MFVYEKKLQYPVKIANTNPKLASIVLTQYGGPDGELGASLRYLSQRYTMPYEELKGLLTDIGTEELGEYLDTHRDDREAFELFQNYAKLYREGRKAYEEAFGPLTMLSSADGGDYDWLKGPWPWEYEANRKEE